MKLRLNVILNCSYSSVVVTLFSFYKNCVIAIAGVWLLSTGILMWITTSLVSEFLVNSLFLETGAEIAIGLEMASKLVRAERLEV